MNNSYTILPSQHIHTMRAKGEIISIIPFDSDQIQPASLDLRLGHYAYPVNTSFLPATGSVMEKMQRLDPDAERFRIDLGQGAVLEKGKVYIVPLLEELALPPHISAVANPKSSTGRLDIFTRLIADATPVFDQLRQGYHGKLYLEIAPRSFSIVARTGERLNQIRFLNHSEDNKIKLSEWKMLIETKQIVSEIQPVEAISKLRFTVDLKGDGKKDTPIGYRARKHGSRIHLDKRNYPQTDFWEPIFGNSHHAIILDPDTFYILMTKEGVAIPPEYAAEMLPYDSRAGEFRVHYAGFFDPGFGWDMATKKAGNSRAVLEVRSHEVPFLLEDGQIVGWLQYEKMSAVPEMLYGNGIKSHYQGQGLKLAKQFYK